MLGTGIRDAGGRIIDARIEQFDRDTKAMRKVYDTISDFAANAGIVTGGRPVPTDVDLRWVGALLHKNGVIEETGLAAGVLNHPATGVAWLANKIAPYDEQLNAGDVVLSGLFTGRRPRSAATTSTSTTAASARSRLLRLTKGRPHRRPHNREVRIAARSELGPHRIARTTIPPCVR